METPDAIGVNVPNSETGTLEVYARSTKYYGGERILEEGDKKARGGLAHRLPSLYHGTWPVKRDPCSSQPMNLSNSQKSGTSTGIRHNDVTGMMSFSSSAGVSSRSAVIHRQRHFGAKVDVVYSLLGMLGSTEGREDMSATLLVMSNSLDSCLVMRQSGCLPLLVQLIHAPGQDPDTRERASKALHNVINARSDEKVGRREARVLRLLEQLRDYCQTLRAALKPERSSYDLDGHPGPTIAALMKLSFDEAHRHAMCQLGGLHAVAELIEVDHASHGSKSDDQNCITLRRYAGMALTNLTFGDGNNKALLCSFTAFMKALVCQLQSLSDDLRQVTASVLRNLSWRADSSSKQTLREVGAVTGLMQAAMEGRKESTLKSILSALWNLSAHCSTNKVDICAVEGALAFLVDMLNYKAPSKTLSIIENAGGILRNVSSHIAVREDYRKIVRERGCLQVLLGQLRSPSLTVVSNACGALWNLSARCSHDQRLLWDLGAVPMLRSLVHSKHKMISMGSSAALKNLLSARPAGSTLVHLDSTARGLGLPTLPTLVARRQRALQQEIDQNLSETCDNIEPSTSPTNKDDRFSFKLDQSIGNVATRSRSYQAHGPPKYNSSVPRSDSRESMRSVTSTHSDTIFERVNRRLSYSLSPAELQIKQQSSSLHSAVGPNGPPYFEAHGKNNSVEKKYTRRYKNSIPERVGPAELEVDDLRYTTSTMSWATASNQESACSQMLMHSSIDDSLSPTDTSRLSITRTNKDFASSAKNSRVNCKSPSPGSPCDSLTFVSNSIELTMMQQPVMGVERPVQSSTLGRANEAESFQVYAETDLDQPTNYSLRYAERNSDEDEKPPSVAYFAKCEHDFEDTIKTYCTEGTPYETPCPTSSGTASDTDLPDTTRTTRSILKKLNMGRINDAELEIRRKGYSQETQMLLDSDVHDENLNVSPRNHAANSSTMMLVNVHHDDGIIEPSESAADSANHVVAERSPKGSSHTETLTSSFDTDCAASIDNAVAQLNSLVLSDEPKINDSFHQSELPVIGTRTDYSLDGENFPESMVSDGDDDDEDLLAACIHIGMQNNKRRQSFRRNSLQKTPPTETNLTRYQTSIALDQVEVTGHVNQAGRSSKSDSTKFNIKMNTTPINDCDNSEIVAEGYASFEDNFNVAKDNNKITVQYQKLQEYSCEDEEEGTDSNSDCIDGKIAQESIKSLETAANHAIRANSVEDNRVYTEIVNDVAVQSYSGSNQQITDFRGMESFDSGRALLQLCMAFGSPEAKTIPMSDSDSVLANLDSVAGDTSLNVTTEISVDSRRTLIGDHRDVPNTKVANLSVTKEKQMKNVEDEYRRRRDPDAMIASLDRLTATLVQQTEAIRERDLSAMKQSVLSDSWNEDSPNDVSYPSISVSAPLIASFKSDMEEEQALVKPLPILKEGQKIDATSSMTGSRIIEREAIRLAEAVSAQATGHSDLDYDASSLALNDLETIKPPSTINSLISLTASYVGPFEHYDATLEQRDRCHSISLSPIRGRVHTPLDPRNGRKKSLPIGVMAKRALAHGISHAGSLESLLNDCSIGTSSQLENVMPPSIMDELLDNWDMENSMLSVASITSEIADPKDQDSSSITGGSDPMLDLVKPVANVLSLSCMRYAEAMQTSANDSISEYLENINPPSLLNEISDMDDSTAEANTGTLCCSNTLCISTELPTEEGFHPVIADGSEEFDNDTDEATMPITTESCVSSSAESTPKKRLNKNHLTPKQRRQLAQERFKTYTIAAEFVKKEDEERGKRENATEAEIGKMSCGMISPYTRLTPKQRRQEDPARFQTQVLKNSFPDCAERIQHNQQQVRAESLVEQIEQESQGKSLIPTLSNICGGKTFRKKRFENNENSDRYRTRTLDDVRALLHQNERTTTNGSAAKSSDERIVEDIQDDVVAREAIQTMLQQNANIVLHTLNETSRVTLSNVDDAMLDCETLSLISNDSESEHSLRMRFGGGSGGGRGNRILTKYAQRVSQQEARWSETESPEIAEGDGVCVHDEKLEITEISSSESDEEDASSRNKEHQPQEAKRPRIVKPTSISRDRSGDSEEIPDKYEPPESPKAIRGRRKALYLTPNARKTTPQSSPIKRINNVSSGIPIGRSNASSPPVVRATRATTLRQNTNAPFNSGRDSARSNIVQKLPQVLSTEKRGRNTGLAKRSSIPQRGLSYVPNKLVKRHGTPPASVNNKEPKDGTPPIKPLERQGTFTKNEPEVENAPTVVFCTSPTKSKIAQSTKVSPPVRTNPISSIKSKISDRIGQDSQQTRMTQCSGTERMVPSKFVQYPASAKRIAAVEPTLPRDKCYIDQANAQGTNAERGRTMRRVTSLGQRSSSNSSIVSSSGAQSASRKLPPKEATSKIASLWKKVEDTKNKQKLCKPDTRQWITALANVSTDSQEVATDTTAATLTKTPAFRLFRSSTFEGMPHTDDDNVQAAKTQRTTRMFQVQTNSPRYRNSCDLTAMTPTDAPCRIPVTLSSSRTSTKETSMGYGTIILRKQCSIDASSVTENDSAKRLSRLGSFIRVDSSEVEASVATGANENTVRTPISAIVPPFNYHHRQEKSISTTKTSSDQDDDACKLRTDMVTGSARVTTV